MNISDITVTSTDLVNGAPMPIISLCSKYNGSDVSPSLKWEAVDNAKCYSLYCYDPDVPGGKTWIHWFISYIPPNITQLPPMTNVNTKYVFTKNGDLLIQCKNSNKKYSYGGPCPDKSGPRKLHRYFFTIYALDKIIDHSDHSDYPSFLDNIKGHVIGKGHIMGTFMKL